MIGSPAARNAPSARARASAAFAASTFWAITAWSRSCCADLVVERRLLLPEVGLLGAQGVLHLAQLHAGVFELLRRPLGGAGGDVTEPGAAGGLHRVVGVQRFELAGVATGAVQRDRTLPEVGLEHFALGGKVGALCVELGEVGDVLVDRRLRGVALLGGLLELVGGLVRGELRGLDLGARSHDVWVGLDQIPAARAQPVPQG